MMIDCLLQADLQWLYALNGSNNIFLDQLMALLTNGLIWIPFYLALFYLIIKNNEDMSQILLVILCAVGCVLITTIAANFIAKPLVARLRPCSDPAIKYTIQVVNNMRPGDFSFFSAHAANTMALAVFICWVVRSRLLGISMLLWSLLNGYTRLYLGVHYPSDVLVGFLCGAVVATAVYLLFHKIYYRISQKLNYISTQYTSTGYANSDIYVVIGVLLFTFVFALMKTAMVIN